jgi:hypothetical protein
VSAPKRFDVATGLTSPSRYLASLGCDIRMPAMAADGRRPDAPGARSGAPEATHAQVPDVERHAREDDAGHFVILACTKHDHHQGHQLIARSFPAGWVCFAQFHSPYYGFDAFHYGPPLPKETPR